MGYVKVKVKVRNVHIPKNAVEIELLADPNAIYTICGAINLKYS
jgi:hypothetical protein